MKIVFARQLRDIVGNEIRIVSAKSAPQPSISTKTPPDPGPAQIMTLGFSSVEALLMPEERKSVPAPNAATKALGRYKLAQRIHGATEPVEVSVEEIIDIKTMLPVRWPPPLICGQACEMIEVPVV